MARRAGWYDDPWLADDLRWWDGDAWTDWVHERHDSALLAPSMPVAPAMPTAPELPSAADAPVSTRLVGHTLTGMVTVAEPLRSTTSSAPIGAPVGQRSRPTTSTQRSDAVSRAQTAAQQQAEEDRAAAAGVERVQRARERAGQLAAQRANPRQSHAAHVPSAPPPAAPTQAPASAAPYAAPPSTIATTATAWTPPNPGWPQQRVGARTASGVAVAKILGMLFFVLIVGSTCVAAVVNGARSITEGADSIEVPSVSAPSTEWDSGVAEACAEISANPSIATLDAVQWLPEFGDKSVQLRRYVRDIDWCVLDNQLATGAADIIPTLDGQQCGLVDMNVLLLSPPRFYNSCITIEGEVVDSYQDDCMALVVFDTESMPTTEQFRGGPSTIDGTYDGETCSWSDLLATGTRFTARVRPVGTDDIVQWNGVDQITAWYSVESLRVHP